MIGMRFQQAKAAFFTQPAVRRALDERTYRFLRHQGGYVRKAARSPMKVSRDVSPPGVAPRRHVGLLHDLLYFAFDPGSRSVVVGPVKLNRRDPYPNVTVPELMEHGGVVQTRRRRRRRAARYAARPYMGPALEAASREDVQAKHWREAWKRSVR